MKSVDNIRRGDLVIRNYGKHKGLVGKVVDRKPNVGLVVSHIKVQIDFIRHDIQGDWRDIYNRYFRETWTPIGRWRKFNE